MCEKVWRVSSQGLDYEKIVKNGGNVFANGLNVRLRVWG